MTTTQEIVEHRDAMVDVFTEITQDCQLLGLTPLGAQVYRWPSGSITADVQFMGTDLAAVDALAESYRCQEGPGTAKANYTRTGRLDIGGHRVHVTIYTGRPELPAVPAGYAPQAVEA